MNITKLKFKNRIKEMKFLFFVYSFYLVSPIYFYFYRKIHEYFPSVVLSTLVKRDPKDILKKLNEQKLNERKAKDLILKKTGLTVALDEVKKDFLEKRNEKTI